MVRKVPDMGKVESKLLALQKRKDSVMEISREMIRLAGRSITLMHAKRLAQAKTQLRRLEALERRLHASESGFEYFSMQAHQEYVEAKAFYIVLNDRRLASADELRVAEVPYLLGVMDLTGELKREAIDAIREKDLDAADSYYSMMKGIYDSTRAMRFASSLVPDFRRKQDTARIQLETTAGELIAAGRSPRYV